MTAIEALDQQVKAACPKATGVSIGRWNDKRTWRVFSDDPTEQQAARAIFGGFDKAAFEANQVPAKTRMELLAELDAASSLAQAKSVLKELLK